MKKFKALYQSRINEVLGNDDTYVNPFFRNVFQFL